MTKPIINWDGKTIPEGLKQVPPGAYALEPIPESDELTAMEEDGLKKALEELDAGKGMSLADVVSEIRSRTGRR